MIREHRTRQRRHPAAPAIHHASVQNFKDGALAIHAQWSSFQGVARTRKFTRSTKRSNVESSIEMVSTGDSAEPPTDYRPALDSQAVIAMRSTHCASTRCGRHFTPCHPIRRRIQVLKQTNVGRHEQTIDPHTPGHPLVTRQNRHPSEIIFVLA